MKFVVVLSFALTFVPGIDVVRGRDTSVHQLPKKAQGDVDPDAKAVANVATFLFLATVESISPNACALILKGSSEYGDYLEPIYPVAIPYLQSKSAKIRFATVRFVLSAGKQSGVDPILKNLETEECLYVVAESLEIFFRYKGGNNVNRGLEVLLQKSVNLPDAKMQSCPPEKDARFYGWPREYPIELHLQNRIVLAITAVGPESLPILERSLKNKEATSTTKTACACAARRIFSKDAISSKTISRKTAESMISHLIPQLNENDETLVIAAISAIEVVAVASGRQVPELAQLAKDARTSKVVRNISEEAIKSIDRALRK